MPVQPSPKANSDGLPRASHICLVKLVDSYFTYFADQKQSVEDMAQMKEIEDNEVTVDAKTVLR